MLFWLPVFWLQWFSGETNSSVLWFSDKPKVLLYDFFRQIKNSCWHRECCFMVFWQTKSCVMAIEQIKSCFMVNWQTKRNVISLFSDKPKVLFHSLYKNKNKKKSDKPRVSFSFEVLWQIKSYLSDKQNVSFFLWFCCLSIPSVSIGCPPGYRNSLDVLSHLPSPHCMLLNPLKGSMTPKPL